MKIYTTLYPKDFKEFFGDEYNFEERRFTDKSRFKKYKIEHYYHQEISDDDIFLLIPNFSQVCLVNLLKMDNIKPTYVTMYKDKKPTDPFFKGVGIVCHVNEIDFTLFNCIEKVQNINKVYSPIFDLLNSAFSTDFDLGNDEQKKTLINTNQDLTKLYSSINNQNYIPPEYYQSTGTDRGVISYSDNKSYIPRHIIMFFSHEETKYYCVLTLEKAYFYIDCSNNESIDNETVKALDNYINSLQIAEVSKSDKMVSTKKSINNRKDADKLENELSQVYSLYSYDNDEKDFFLKIEAKDNSPLEEMSSFLPIPISNKKIYKEFYFFINHAFKKRKFEVGISDKWETKISITIDSSIQVSKQNDKEENQIKREYLNHFYTTYSLYFLSQYNHAINKLHENIKTTLINIIPNIIYKKSKNIGTEIIYNFLEKLQRLDIDKAQKKATQLQELFSLLLNHRNINYYFLLNVDDSKKYRQFINNNLTKNEKVSDSEFDEINQTKEKIQKKLLDNNNCLSDDQKKLLKKFRGKRFQSFDIYLDPYSDFTIYYDLSNKCQEIIDEYFNIESSSLDDDFKENINDKGIIEKELSSTSNIDELNLEKQIEPLINLFNYLNIETEESDKIKKTPLRPKEILLLEELITNFLESYEKLDSRIYNYLDIKKYFQVLLIFIESHFGGIHNKGIEIKYIKNRIREMFLLLSNTRNKTAEVLGNKKFNDWLSRTFNRIYAYNLIGLIKSNSEYTFYQKNKLSKKDRDSDLMEKEKQNWEDIEQSLFFDAISNSNYEESKKTLPKDIRLDQQESSLSIRVYLKTLIDISEIGLNYSIKVLAKKLDELEKIITEGSRHKLFKNFLKGDVSTENKVLFLDKVVVEPNKYFLGMKEINIRSLSNG